uniref:Cytochrome c oxidase assembly protein COX20, mitochondrial n=1 Tax=Rhabditophanes sp. KR3021 TaxID=114890 RepID=A0AC35U2G1_9BILA
MSTPEDQDNPAIERKKFLGFIQTDPVTSTTIISMFSNIVLTNMFIYGFTGNGRLAFLTSAFGIPCSVYSCLKYADQDWEQWQKQAKLRERGVPERFLPYKCKYDWTGYEGKMVHTEPSTNK